MDHRTHLILNLVYILNMIISLAELVHLVLKHVVVSVFDLSGASAWHVFGYFLPVILVNRVQLNDLLVLLQVVLLLLLCPLFVQEVNESLSNLLSGSPRYLLGNEGPVSAELVVKLLNLVVLLDGPGAFD